MDMIIKRALEFCKDKVKEAIEEGCCVLDATCGNGNDTLFLAQQVGNGGKVFAFDIQNNAIDTTKELLNKHKVLERVYLYQESHECIDNHIKTPLKAAMFNLGYLPGGDHTIITKPAATIKALDQTLKLLLKGGIITITVYTGHPGGQEEKKELVDHLEKLDQSLYNVLQYSFVNQVNSPPEAYIIERK